MPPRLAATAAFVALLWAGNFILTQAALDAHMTPLLLVAARFALASSLVLVTPQARGRRLVLLGAHRARPGRRAVRTGHAGDAGGPDACLTAAGPADAVPGHRCASLPLFLASASRSACSAARCSRWLAWPALVTLAAAISGGSRPRERRGAGRRRAEHPAQARRAACRACPAGRLDIALPRAATAGALLCRREARRLPRSAPSIRPYSLRPSSTAA